jgi:beta-ureidopropionase / N-carbamoyl-L-amino-acid hydrolase
MMASAAYVGVFTTNDILSRKGADDTTVADALDRLGYGGSNPVATQKFTSLVELKIEEGPIPEAEAKPSAWSIPAKACCGRTAKSPCLRVMQASIPVLLHRSTLAAQSEIALAVERERIYSESRRRLSSMS